MGKNFWMHCSRFGAQDACRIDFRHTPTAKVCGSWGCVRGGVEGEAKLCVTCERCHELREVLMHVSGPVQPPSLQLKSTQVIQLFCDINVVNVLVYPFNLRIVRGDGGGRSTDGAAGSKVVICAGFEMTTVLAICASLAGANFRVHSDCRRAKSSAMSLQRPSEEDSSRLSLMCCAASRVWWDCGPSDHTDRGHQQKGLKGWRTLEAQPTAWGIWWYWLSAFWQRLSRGQLSFDAMKWWYSQIICRGSESVGAAVLCTVICI